MFLIRIAASWPSLKIGVIINQIEGIGLPSLNSLRAVLINMLHSSSPSERVNIGLGGPVAPSSSEKGDLGMGIGEPSFITANEKLLKFSPGEPEMPPSPEKEDYGLGRQSLNAFPHHAFHFRKGGHQSLTKHRQ